MAWEARSGLKLRNWPHADARFHVGMAWEARSGLKHRSAMNSYPPFLCRNGLGSPFGIETVLQLA